MSETNLLVAVIESLPVKKIHPLHKAMLEECCEKVESGDNENVDEKTKILAVELAFLTCESVIKGTIKGLAKGFDADKVNLDYRGQTFEIEKGSHFWG